MPDRHELKFERTGEGEMPWEIKFDSYLQDGRFSGTYTVHTDKPEAVRVFRLENVPYPLPNGRVVPSKGLEMEIDEGQKPKYEKVFVESRPTAEDLIGSVIPDMGQRQRKAN